MTALVLARIFGCAVPIARVTLTLPTVQLKPGANNISLTGNPESDIPLFAIALGPSSKKQE
jgi:hypothetical protein